MEIDINAIDDIILQNESSATNLIPILSEIQDKYRYIDERVFEHLSKKLNVSVARIYSVATFYENFSLVPKGKHIIRICDGTACHLRNNMPILKRLRQDLNLAEGEVTTKDMLFTVETVSCLGACGLAPVVMVNDSVHPAMTPDLASELITKIREEEKTC